MAISGHKRRYGKRTLSNRPHAPMHLSRDDLAQLDDTHLQALQEQRLRVLAVKLLADLKEAHERLGQTPDNSSRPPSSRAPWEGSTSPEVSPAASSEDVPSDSEEAPEVESGTADPAPESETKSEAEVSTSSSSRTRAPNRPGRRPGSEGHGRTQRLSVHEQRPHHPAFCAICAEAVCASWGERLHSAHYVIDLILPSAERTALEVIQIKHLYYARQCCCGHWTSARPHHQGPEEDWTVALSERHLAGARLVALICALSVRMRLSRRRIQEFLADWLGLSLGIATINHCLHEAGRALDPVVEEQLLAQVRASDLVHADETSWKEQGKLVWLWVFTSATTTVFRIGRRSRELLHGVLGEVFHGWLMSDGYWAYRAYDNRLRCLAHLLRKARGLEESLDGQAQRFGQRLHEHLQAVMDSVYAAREGPPMIPLRQQHAAALNALLDLCLVQANCAHAKMRALARELLNDWDTYWVVLDHPE